MIQIVTDTASDITLDEAKELNIHIVPLNIEFEDGDFPQETNEDFNEFYVKLENAKELPKTSQPSPGLYLDIFEQAEENGDEVLVITLSSGLSGLVNAVNMAKDMCDYDKIYVYDSKQAVATQRIMVEYAVELRDKNKTIPEIIDSLEKIRTKLTVGGVIDTLKYLRKGGRIPIGFDKVGDLLDLKPLIELKDGKLEKMGISVGRKAGIKTLHERFEKFVADRKFPIYFLYTSDRKSGKEFMDEMIEKYHLQEYKTRLVQVCGVVGTHLGTGGIGIAYVTQ